MTRREAREAALCVLFAFGYTPDKSAEELIDEYKNELDGGADGIGCANVTLNGHGSGFCRKGIGGLFVF